MGFCRIADAVMYESKAERKGDMLFKTVSKVQEEPSPVLPEPSK